MVESNMENWNLILGQRIASRHKKNSFISCITKAERGMGKSMYNLKSMAQAYYILNEDGDEKRAWGQALDSFIFTPTQLMDIIDTSIAEDRIHPVICIDDAAVHFSGYLFFVNVYLAALMNAAFDTIRTATSAVLINCPQKSRLLKALRNYDDHEITLYAAGKNPYEKKAVAIKWYSLPDGTKRFRKEWEDHFSVYVPNWVYHEYLVMRKRYLAEINEELKKLKDKLGSQKQKGRGKVDEEKAEDELFNYD